MIGFDLRPRDLWTTLVHPSSLMVLKGFKIEIKNKYGWSLAIAKKSKRIDKEARQLWLTGEQRD